MKKSEHYKEALAALEAEKKRIATEISIIRKELVAAMNEESPFKPGDKVRFRNWSNQEWQEGIFGRYHLAHLGIIKPSILKIKKDGTASATEHWVDYNHEILPAE